MKTIKKIKLLEELYKLILVCNNVFSFMFIKKKQIIKKYNCIFLYNNIIIKMLFIVIKKVLFFIKVFLNKLYYSVDIICVLKYKFIYNVINIKCL